MAKTLDNRVRDVLADQLITILELQQQIEVLQEQLAAHAPVATTPAAPDTTPAKPPTKTHGPRRR
jgi:hypothetical protein